MAAKSHALEFDGYWREPNIGGLPADSGIYCVYACTYDPQSNTVSIRKLLYIGEAENIRERVSGHERWNDWLREVYAGEQLCFNAALISPTTDRQRAEAAMIFRHKPPCNSEYKNTFPFDQTTITTQGRNALLEKYFIVYTTPPTVLGAGLLGSYRW